MSGRFMVGLATPGNATSYAAGSKTIPDITMGSLASGFDEEEAENEQLRRQNGGDYGRYTPDYSETPRRQETTVGSPPTAIRRSASHDAVIQSPARPARSRTSTGRSGSSEQDENLGASVLPSSRRYLAVGNATNEDETDDLMNQKSIALEVSPQWEISQDEALRKENKHLRRATEGPMDGRLPARKPRHSVATSGNESTILLNGEAQMSLRTQVENVKLMKQENFNLKLELEMLRAQLATGFGKDKATLVQENTKLKITNAEQHQESEKWRKASVKVSDSLRRLNEDHLELQQRLADAERTSPEVIEDLKDRLEEAERIRAEDRAAIEDLENVVAEYEDRGTHDETLDQLKEEADHLRTDLEAAEENVAALREREDDHVQEIETLQQELMDIKAELEKAEDDKERALEKLGDMAADGSADEVQRLQQEVLDLEADKASLQAELEALRLGAKAKDDQRHGDQERISHLTKEIETINARTMDIQRSASRAGDLELEHERLARIVSDRENEIVQLREEVERLDSEMHAQDRDLHGYREELEDTVERLRRVQAERNELDDNLAETMAIIEQKNEDLNIMRDNLEGALSDLSRVKEDLRVTEDEKEAFKRELAQADSDLDQVDSSKANLTQELRDTEDELAELREAESAARQDLEHQRTTVDELSRKLGDLEARHRQDIDAQRRLTHERDEIQSSLKRAETAYSDETRQLRRELNSELERYKQLISDKEQSNVRLSHELEVIRERVSERDRDVRDLQNALKGLESDKRRIGDDHLDDRRSLELEIDRVKRDLGRSEDDLDHAQREVDRLEQSLAHLRSDLSEMAEEKSRIESLLTSERQERLKLSDKLTAAEKTVKQSEAEVLSLRDRVEELERIGGGGRAFTPRRGSDMAQKDALALLQTLYVKVTKLCGIEEHGAPSSFVALKDKLLQRLRQLQSTNSEWERQIRSLEIRLESQTSALSRELDAKKKLLDGVETSVQKMSQTKLAWKTKLTMKDDEISDLRGRLKDLQFQLSTLKMSTTTETTTEIRTIQSRATHAEKRAATLANQLTALQEATATSDSKHQTAISKWEARVKEYERRLREAGEMIKVEKQGGKERVADLEQQLRSLTAQRDAINAKTARLESIMNMAGMGRKDDPDAL